MKNVSIDSIYILLVLFGFSMALTKEVKALNNNIITSEISGYAVILLVEVKQASPMKWEDDHGNELNEQRKVYMSLKLVKQFKGPKLREQNQSFEIYVIQFRPKNGRFSGNYGPWSNYDFDGNKQILLFCKQQDSREPLDTTIAQGCELMIQEPDHAYPHAIEDIKKLYSLTKLTDYPNILMSDKLQKDIFNIRNQIGPLMARFLIEQYTAIGHSNYEFFIRLLSNPDTAAMFRHIVMSHFVDGLMLSDDIQIDVRLQLVRAMANIMSEPEDLVKVLQESITQAYFYSVVFGPVAKPYFPASRVFPDQNERKLYASLIIKHVMDNDKKKHLEKWFVTD
ncbi:MAG: hypothetical protein OEZ39_08095 [Gammaproteobacteria bacterium]|nr:hypothetical protein [Gammaproteobacteria bacterium]MDH5651822.1 hypothetical protein [Gammaproteobacteria bacterium]